MARIDICVAIIRDEMAKNPNMKHKLLREKCIDRIVAEASMTPKGASTYYSNAKGIINGNPMVNKYVPKEQQEHIMSTFVPTGVDPTTRNMWSVVSFDSISKIATYVSAHHDKVDAMSEGAIKKLPVVNGLQIIGKSLGVIEKGTNV